MKLISIRQAATCGIARLRQPIWACAMDHIKIDILVNDQQRIAFAGEGGDLGPWVHLYSPMNLAIGNKEPVTVMFTMYEIDVESWEPYISPLPDSDEYKQEQCSFATFEDTLPPAGKKKSR